MPRLVPPVERAEYWRDTLIRSCQTRPRQEYYKGNAEDMATVMSLTESLSIPYGSYSGMLMTREWSALDATPVIEYKYHAKGIGFVLTKGDKTGELGLIDIRKK